MSSEVAIRTADASKCFILYAEPRERFLRGLCLLCARLLPADTANYFRTRALSYGKSFQALQHVNLTVSRGETVGIIGRNGSGKSTLLQLVCGTLLPSTGSISVNGRVAALLELGSGFNLEFTGRENVYLNGQLLGLSKRQIDQRFAAIAAFAEIGDFMDQPVKSYSSGMFVRLAFAVIAHVDADILVLDEALAVGDVFFNQKCMRFLRSFQQQGTVLFVSHDTGAVVNLCQRAIWLDNGAVRMIGRASEVCEAYLASQYVPSASSEAALAAAPAIPNPVGGKAMKKWEGRDMRRDFVNNSRLRNDIEVFTFSTPERFFGTGEAIISAAYLTDDANRPLGWVVGGEPVRMVVSIEVEKELSCIIIGFFFKDRLGQVLFGDNTYLNTINGPVQASPGDRLEARFSFCMPILPKGSYTVDVAVADGTIEKHRQLHWIHDAFAVESHAASTSTGLVGIPMQDITIIRQAAQETKR